jgi:Spy/CpxP family protein refolding chaperone
MKSTIALLFLLGYAAATAQHHSKTAHQAAQASPYSGEEQRSIKALSDDMIDGYRMGRGMGLAKAAELNHYPGPMHILQLKEKLRLSPEQIAILEKTFDQMHNETVPLGNSLIEQEQMLDSVFRTAKADSINVRQFTARIGELQGKIRFAHLNAHITARKILTAEQIALYDKERGYVSDRATMQKKKGRKE